MQTAYFIGDTYVGDHPTTVNGVKAEKRKVDKKDLPKKEKYSLQEQIKILAMGTQKEKTDLTTYLSKL